MQPIPRMPLLLGLAGLAPFLWGLGTMMVPALERFAIARLGPRFAGPYIQLSCGTIALAFMAGVLWGFASKARGAEAALGYALSTLPALWAFLFVGQGPVSSAIYLMVGFVGTLGLDWSFAQRGLAPPWWMRLRVLLTAIVLLTLSPVAF